MLFAEVARTSADVATTSSRRAKVERLANLLGSLEPQEVAIAVAYLSGALPQGSIGIGWATLTGVPAPSASPPSLSLLEVDATLERVGSLTGAGSQAARRRELDRLFAGATDAEQRFLRDLLTGGIRQGALEGVMVEAVARAAALPLADVRRAAMLAGDLRTVAAAAIGSGREGLHRFRLTPLRPVQPMLAQSADDISTALARVPPAAVEWKLDGARIQIHRLGEEVRVFTRSLADVTDRLPEIVDAMRGLPLRSAVFDAEAIALRPDGRPHPFGLTMSRFGSRLQSERLRAEVPLSALVFDVLHLDGEDLLGRPANQRVAAMEGCLPAQLRVPRIVTDDADEAERFLHDALARGHEGVVVKALDAPYEAGRRGAGWIKVKRAKTLDLVVLAAEWGHGRRRGWLSNLHLGARDPQAGGFIMLGKTFKGMTDETLASQTERLLQIETHREGITVFVRPELVVEVAFDGLQRSSRYPGGLALRFARLKGYRPDRTAGDADTIDTVRDIHDRSLA